MGLTATEISNSTASRFDVELIFYAGLTYSALDPLGLCFRRD